MFNRKNRLKFLLFLAIAWELFIFVRLPKQAFMQGLLESWFVNHGLMFYKDFGGQYLPFLRLLMVPLHQIFGYNQFTTIFLAPITSIAILCVLYYASKKYINGWFSLIPIIFFSIWHTFLSNNHFEATLFLGLVVLISLILWLSWWDRPTYKKSFAIGLLSAFGVFTLQIVLPFYALLNLSFLLRFGQRVKKSSRYLLISFLGFLIPALAIIFWFWVKGALNDLYIGAILYHFTNYPYSKLGRGVEDIFIYLSIHIPLFLFLFSKAKVIKKLAFFSILISLPLTFWFAIFHPLRFEISLPVFALIFGMAVQDIYQYKSLKFFRIGIVLLSFILLVNIFTSSKYRLLSYENKLFEANYSHQIISKVYPDDPMYSAIEWMKVNSQGDDKIFVLGDALFYIESARLPSSKRAVALDPALYYPFEESRNEINSSWPEYWVIDERQWARIEAFGYRESSNKLQALAEQDPVVAEFDYWTIRKH